MPRIEPLSWHPRAWLYHNLLTPEECAYFIAKASPEMEASQVVDNDSGDAVDSEVRTSSGAFLTRDSDPIIAALEQRIADWTHVPIEHGEGFHGTTLCCPT